MGYIQPMLYANNDYMSKAIAMCFEQYANTSKQMTELYKQSILSQEARKKAEKETALQTLDEQVAVQKQKIIEATQQKVQVPVTEDGIDDGRLTGKVIAKSVGTGLLKKLKSFVCDENGKVSLGKIALTGAMVAGGAALIAVTGGAAAPFLVGAGVLLGGTEVVKGGVRYAVAKTDAEAKAAVEDMTGGAVDLGLSVAGAKASVKAAGLKPKSFLGSETLGAVKQCTAKTIKEPLKAVFTKTGRADASAFYQNTVKTNVKNMLGSENAKVNVEKFNNKVYDKDISKLEAKRNNIAAKIAEGKSTPEELANLRSELKTVQKKIETLEAQRAEIASEVKPEVNKKELDAVNEKIKAHEKEVEMFDDVEILENPEAYNNAINNQKNLVAAKNSIENNKTVEFARQNTLETLTTENKALEAKLANLSDKAEISKIKVQIKRNNRMIAETQRYQRVEAQQKLISENQAQLDKLNAEIKSAGEKIIKLDANKNAEEIATINKAIAELQSKAGEYEGIINKAKLNLNTFNVKTSFIPEAKNGLPFSAIASSSIEGANYSNIAQAPEMQEKIVTAPEQKQALATLDQMAQKAKEEIEFKYSSKSVNTNVDPFMAQMMGMSTPGIDSLAFYRPSIPDIV